MKKAKYKGLKEEINKTLNFFIVNDLLIYGKVTETTKEAFKAQGVEFPKKFE